MNKRTNSIQLPVAVMRRVNRAAKNQKRTPSDLAAEAMRWYFRMSTVPEELPTQAELRAIRRGRKAFEKGEYIPLDELRREKGLVRRPRRARAKVS